MSSSLPLHSDSGTRPPAEGWLRRRDAGRFSEAGSFILGLCLLLLAAYSVTAAGGVGPPVVRLGCALAGLVFLPGYALSRILLRDPDSEWPERLAVSVGLGFALQAALALMAHLLDIDFGFELWLLPAIGLVLLLAEIGRRKPCVRVSVPKQRSWFAWAVTAMALVAAALWAGIQGSPLGLQHDSLDHIATIGRMAETGVVFPLDAYYADAGITGADPRKGLFHTLLALLVRVTDLDPVQVWKACSGLLAPLLVLAAHVLARRVARSSAAGAVAAVLTLLIYGGGPGSAALREAVYSTRMADMLSVLTVWAVLGALSRGGRRNVLLAAVLAFAAVTTHVFSAIYIALASMSLILGVAVGYHRLPLPVLIGSRRQWFTRAGWLAISMFAVCAPYLALRYRQAYAPADPIHLEPQGLLFWVQERFYTVDAWTVSGWLGWPGLALLLALPFLWRRRHHSLGTVYLVSSTVTVFALILNPLVLPLLHGFMGYLVMRLIWCVPLATGLAVTVVFALRSIGGAASPTTRRLARLAVAATALCLLPPLAGAVDALRSVGRPTAAGWQSSGSEWQPLGEFLRHHWHGPRVILSDAATSYWLAAHTRHYVTTLMPQHASPNDPLGETRLVEARDVLSAFVGIRETVEILRRRSVDVVVLNQSFAVGFAVGPQVITPDLYQVTRRKFSDHPELFRQIWSREGFHVFELTAAARRGALPENDPVRPSGSSQGDAFPAETHQQDGVFRHHRTRVEPSTISPGQELRLTTSWSLAPGREVRPGRYNVSVHLVGNLSGEPFFHAAISKPYRKVLERITGKTYRLRSDHVPASDFISPDRWPRGELIEDRFTIPVPETLVPGVYQVRVKVQRVPEHYNSRLRDYFFDEDGTSGPVVATVIVEVAR